MSDHTTALVPIEAWCYNSPEVRYKGKHIDVGLFAESLIYYNRILLNVGNPSQFAELINWLIENDNYQQFIQLLNEGTVKLYDFAFLTTAINKDGVFSVWNMQDPIQSQPDTFEQRYLNTKEIESCIKKARHRVHLYEAVRGNVIEVKANAFESAVVNAKADNGNAQRNALILQAMIDELYHFRKLGTPPIIEAKVISSPDKTKHKITWNIDFDHISKISGKNLNFHDAVPLIGGANSNRLLLAASDLKCDIYLGQPMSSLVGDKLYESNHTRIKCGDVIETLKEKVDFPDLRYFVNANELSLKEIIKIRKKARRFREWLQVESDRDLYAIIAYHHEVAKESGFIKCSRKAINLFGVLGGGAAGSLLGSSISGTAGAAIGGIVGSGVGYLADIASKLGSDWRPVIFGNWAKDRIEKVLKDEK
jgi:hypothetical protein